VIVLQSENVGHRQLKGGHRSMAPPLKNATAPEPIWVEFGRKWRSAPYQIQHDGSNDSRKHTRV